MIALQLADRRLAETSRRSQRIRGRRMQLDLGI
jgi:hypothetical protein